VRIRVSPLVEELAHMQEMAGELSYRGRGEKNAQGSSGCHLGDTSFGRFAHLAI
jgi:hypothetical protein